MTSMRLLLLAVALLTLSTCEAKPFFDAIYDAVLGNGKRSYGYNGYGYGYNPGYASPSGPRNVEKVAPRAGKSFKDICRVHFPDSIASPGAGGIVCPY